ncbi:CATRA system-associated protein [Actinoplanes derwentensis]|uniref:CATRA-Associated Small Protein domain-containing protein n=1 Tax=Actinoplanes derwentensis TaxID=113562 RepID=A0A1H1Y751_9ACTN|nr:CATRA system-associated protein [Actinoplanes derwentensis]GID86695.1 hypothetical protein Ade03nite_56190 [Actinoplanes derwentensis]SDT17257.1 hypothetical protein SAMN04489716_2733 [Actinoplanes derwentensis]
MFELLDDLWMVLDKTEEWYLSERRWALIDVLLERVSVALGNGSVDALRQAIRDLELSGHDRGRSADSGPPGKQPPKTRDKVQQIRDQLDPPKAAAKEASRGGSGR